jgi:rubrerythrin
MKVEEMQLGDPDEKGRRKPMPTGRFKELSCDTVIYALGTKANPDGATQSTSLPGVFAGGDIVTGGATVILAMGAGRRAARAIAAYLRNGKQWPVTQEQAEAFVPPAPLGAGQTVVAPADVAEPLGLLCPKCHREIEGDEPYVCCAGARLAWRCDDCGKVSEGFAFPYGMCPSCGGSLQGIEEKRPEGAAALEAIRNAFEIELGGMAFYQRAAREAADPAMRDLFARFAEMEKQHMATLSGRYHVDPPAPADLHLDRAAVYAGIPNRPDQPDNLFRIAIAFEERAAKFFAAHQIECAPGSAEAQIYKELAAEEREHVALLSTELERWKAGKPGLL